jgi:shikimate kinase
MKNIILIGLPGSGKSFYGKKIEEKNIGYKFVDGDLLIINHNNGRDLQSFLDEVGDNKVLALEKALLMPYAKGNNFVIAPGGSAVYTSELMSEFGKNGTIVYLCEDINIILGRENVDYSTRGLVGLKEKGILKLCEERKKLCERYANITLDFSRIDKNNISVVDLILYKTKK